MLHIKKLKTFFQKNEAARPPPILQKETFFEPAIILFRTERKNMNPPAKQLNQKQNFKTPPHFFESTRGPPELQKMTFFIIPGYIQSHPSISAFLIAFTSILLFSAQCGLKGRCNIAQGSALGKTIPINIERPKRAP